MRSGAEERERKLRAQFQEEQSELKQELYTLSVKVSLLCIKSCLWKKLCIVVYVDLFHAVNIYVHCILDW